MTSSRKLSSHAQLLLSALAQDPQAWRHGYELLKRTGLKSGTLYPLLIRLNEQGLMDAEWQAPAEPGRPPRHAYRITQSGIRAAAAFAAAGEKRDAIQTVTA
jgi:DNA-binding PadR family transcriptional regulator